MASLVGFCGQPLSGLTGPASSRSSVKQPALFIPVRVSTASQLETFGKGGSDVYLLFVTLQQSLL